MNLRKLKQVDEKLAELKAKQTAEDKLAELKETSRILVTR